MTRKKDLATSMTEAAQSGHRAAGYCGLVHPSGRASCTGPPPEDDRHVDFYNGRKSITGASGTEWTE